MSLPHIAAKEEAVLGVADKFLWEWVRPRAQQIDQELGSLREALDELGRHGLLGLRVPQKYGGIGLDDRAFRRFQEQSARCSGSLAFLQTQHQSACSFLAKSDNEQLKAETLPKLATGEMTAGIAFSQLRRKGQPMVVVSERGDVFEVNGTAPWVTGWGVFDRCVTAGTLPNGDIFFFVHELKESGHLQPTAPMKLAAMEVAQTVSVKFERLAVPKDEVLYIRPGNWIDQNDMLNIALQSPFALGCAQAALDVLREAFEKKSSRVIAETADALETELTACRTEAYAAMDVKDDAERSLQARAWAIELAGRCAHAAVCASSGAGNSIQHPAQRIYREALVFSVSAQTTEIMEAALTRFVR